MDQVQMVMNGSHRGIHQPPDEESSTQIRYVLNVSTSPPELLTRMKNVLSHRLALLGGDNNK